MPGKQLLGGEQQTLGTTGLQLEFRLAQVLSLLAGAYLAVIDGQLDFAVLDLDASGGALDNGFAYRAQRGAREAFRTARRTFLSEILLMSGRSSSTTICNSIG